MRSLPRSEGTLSDDRKAILAMLRDARAVVYRDAESFNEAATVLEHVGQMLRSAVLNGLNDYKSAICDLARQAPEVNSARVEFFFDTVRKARNDSVHSGDYIRHHSTRLVELMLMLEEGLAMSGTTARDLMVQSPTIAELWHNVATVRRAMLTNSFSFLPIQGENGEWKLISDVAIVQHLRRATNRDQRGKLLGKQVQKALDDAEITLTTCGHVPPDEPIEEVAKGISQLPVLIVEADGKTKRLLGILTAFDLL
jgi:CBS domain-containing protein